MATYAQLESEPWWGREIVTQALTGAGLMLCAAYGRPASAMGTKGNNAHLSGHHRSQEWIKNSAYCVNDTYTVQSGLTVTQARHIAGLDFTPAAWGTADNRAKMIAITNRLDAAYARGELDGIVRQFFGTKNGTTVFGRDVPTGRIISADDSHLDHEHVGFDRRRADDNEATAMVARIMIGDDMTVADVRTGLAQMFDEGANRSTPTGRQFADDFNAMMAAAGLRAVGEKLDEIATGVDEIKTLLESAGGSPDNGPVLAAIAAVSAKVDLLMSGVRANAAAVGPAVSE
jgi:hypothetical protein